MLRAGWPFVPRGWRSPVNRSLDIAALIAMRTGVAWSYGTVAALAPGTFRQRDGRAAICFDAATGIAVLVLLGQPHQPRRHGADLR